MLPSNQISLSGSTAAVRTYEESPTGSFDNTPEGAWKGCIPFHSPLLKCSLKIKDISICSTDSICFISLRLSYLSVCVSVRKACVCVREACVREGGVCV